MKHSLLLICVAMGFFANAQISRGGEPSNWNIKDLNRFDVTFEEFDALDMALINSQDEVTDAYKETEYRFGIERDVDFNTENSGTWETLDNGTQVWRLGVHCPDANSISFHLNQYRLEKGAKLFFWNEDRTKFLGSFTHLNNKAHGELPISFMYDDRVVIEYVLPEGTQAGELAISKVIHGYRGLANKWSEERGPFGNSGACNINANCPEGDDWDIEKRSVALILNGGNASCTGTLVNNTANDGTPYFLTANHCLGNPQNWTYVFNHETEGCIGNDGPIDDTVASGELRASNAGSDFALIELSEAPPVSYNVQFSGWDKSDDETVTAAVGIHHPSGDLKKICFEDDSPYHSTQAGAGVWFIDQWELGVTEPGSSGSALYDQNHRLIGQLFGGAAACNGTVNNGAFDYYGRFGVSWDGASSSTRLRDWLDPQGLNPNTLDGFPEGFSQLEFDASVSIDTSIEGAFCGNGFFPGITVVNGGLQPLTSATITVEFNGAVTQTVNWTGNLLTGESDAFGLNFQTAVDGENTLTVSIESDVDEDTDNNISTLEFNAIADPIFFTLDIILDDFGSETTWDVKNAQDEILAQGGPYTDGLDGTLVEEEFCVSEACYDLTVFDAFGDGICCGFGNGSYNLKNQNGVSVVSGAEFTDEETQNFCASTTGVEDIAGFEVVVFPNPSSGEITIQLGTTIDTVELIDISGRLIKTVSVNANQAILDFSDISNGTYVVRALTDQGTYRTTFIKE